MTSFQKVIKYLAMALASFLAIAIIIGIANLGSIVISFIQGDNKSLTSSDSYNFEQAFSDIRSIDIRDIVGRVTFEEGSEFRVKVNEKSENIKVSVSNRGTLKIREKRNSFFSKWFNDNNSSEVIIYLPKDFISQRTYIKSGVGKTRINFLSTEKLEIKAGVGNVNGKNIKADSVKINGGVGSISLKDVVFHEVDVDCGVGDLEIEGDIYGESEFDCGVGNVLLDLNGKIEDYDLKIDSGIGSITVDGERVTNESYKNEDALHKIDIDGGIGNVKIKFQ